MAIVAGQSQVKNSLNLLLLQLALLLAAMLVGAWLRLANLDASPGWYPDEGSDLDIARHLSEGHFQYFVLQGTLLVAARAPLFHLLLAGLFKLFGYDILVARALTAFAGIATIPLLFVTLRRACDEWFAIGVAAIFAVFPLAIVFNRWAFAYNLLMPLGVIGFYCLGRVVESGSARWLCGAALIAALATLTVWVGISWTVCVIVVGWLYARRALLIAIPLAFSLPGVFLLVSYLVAPAAFVQDLMLTFSRSNPSVIEQVVIAPASYAVYLSSYIWILPGTIGLFLTEPRRLRALVLLIYFVLLFSVLRFATVTSDLGFHRVLGIVPWLAIGLGVFLARTARYLLIQVSDLMDRLLTRLGIMRGRLRRFLLTSSTAVVFFFVFGFAPLLITLAQILGFPYPTPPFLSVVFAARDARATVDYLNAHSLPSDVVVASPHIAWALTAHASDFQQSLAYQGAEVDNYPQPLPRERFLFDPSFENARYAVVDSMWRKWGITNIAALRPELTRIETWRIVFESGDFVVYQNPNR